MDQLVGWCKGWVDGSWGWVVGLSEDWPGLFLCGSHDSIPSLNICSQVCNRLWKGVACGSLPRFLVLSEASESREPFIWLLIVIPSPLVDDIFFHFDSSKIFSRMLFSWRCRNLCRIFKNKTEICHFNVPLDLNEIKLFPSAGDPLAFLSKWKGIISLLKAWKNLPTLCFAWWYGVVYLDTRQISWLTYRNLKALTSYSVSPLDVAKRQDKDGTYELLTA